MNPNINISRIKAAYNAFEEMKDHVVFIGGATVSLYADREVIEPRPTDDIDVIVEIMTYKDRTLLEEKLRQKGFHDDVESGIVCRFRIEGITVDIMPTDDPTIGFNTRWYREGFKASVLHRIDDRHTIKILPSPFLIATKIEAFNDRGGGDGRMSQDFEDIVFILEHRSTFWNEVNQTNPAVQAYLKQEFSKWLSNPTFFEWIDSHTERSKSRATNRVIAEINAFTS